VAADDSLESNGRMTAFWSVQGPYEFIGGTLVLLLAVALVQEKCRVDVAAESRMESRTGCELDDSAELVHARRG
jgi:fucose permease